MDDRTSVLSKLAQAMARQAGTDPLAHRLCRSATSLLGAEGGAITLAYTRPERVTLCATDVRAARLEDLQDLLGEGPGPCAYRSGLPIHVVTGTGDSRWPQFESSAREAFGSIAVHAIPIRPHDTMLGVFTCHLGPDRSLLLSARSTQFLMDAVGVALQRDPAAPTVEPGRHEEVDGSDGSDGPWSSRARVHQATGMVVAQLGVPPADALVLLRARAFAQGATLDEVAVAVISRALDFSQTNDQTTGSPDS